MAAAALSDSGTRRGTDRAPGIVSASRGLHAGRHPAWPHPDGGGTGSVPAPPRCDWCPGVCVSPKGAEGGSRAWGTLGVLRVGDCPCHPHGVTRALRRIHGDCVDPRLCGPGRPQMGGGPPCQWATENLCHGGWLCVDPRAWRPSHPASWALPGSPPHAACRGVSRAPRVCAGGSRAGPAPAGLQPAVRGARWPGWDRPPLFYLSSFLPNEQKRGAAPAAAPPREPAPVPGPVPGERGLSPRPGPARQATAFPAPARGLAGGSGRRLERSEPLCPARSVLISSVRIGKEKKKSGKPDLTLQRSAPGEWRKLSQEFGGLENAFEGASTPTERGQGRSRERSGLEGRAGVRLCWGKRHSSPASRPDPTLQALSLSRPLK